MSNININQTKLPPSGISESIRFMRGTGISLYVHGAPGISKSAVARQAADHFGVAFIDFRLTSVASEDIRGVPYADDVGGIRGLFWTPPLVFPRDLNLMGSAKVEGTQVINFYNPVGNNKIHYCKEPVVTAMALDKGHTAEIIKQELNKFVVSLRDDAGNSVTGNVLWTVKGRSQAILGLEEFNSAAPSVMAAAYQLILDRRIGDYVVPDGVMILAMGNRDGDKGVTFKIPKPVANRFTHLEMEVNFDDWQLWAIENDVHPDVIGYLSKWKSELFDPNFAQTPDLSFATPRTWEFVSKIINQPVPAIDSEKWKPILRGLVCGAIGNVIGTKFLSHKQYMDQMPDVRRILDGSITEFKVTDQSFKTQIAYSTCVQMCYELKREHDAIERKYPDRLTCDASPERIKWVKKMDKAIGFAMDNFMPEILMLLNRMVVVVYKLRLSTASMPRFTEFAKTYRGMV